MSTTVVAILIIALIVLVVGAVVGGLIWFLRRRRSAESQSGPKQPVKKPGEKVPTGASKGEPVASATSSTPPRAMVAPSSVTSHPAASPPPTQTEADGEEKIRILIVDDNPDTRENVGRLLYFEKDMEVIGQAINGRHGIDMAVKHKPHIVLMDINMPDMDGITATREMVVVTPFSQVIIMSVQAEQHYMKQAMAAGARDFQPKPFTADELVNCIRRVYKIGQPMYRQFEAAEQTNPKAATQSEAEANRREGAPVIALYSPKGGIGTSTLAANLAVALQQEYGEAVLMDADLQFGDILVHLNTKATRTASDLVHDGELDVELIPEIVLAHNSGLKLLLAPTQPELADSITPEMIGEIIKSLKRHFKIVVVDTASQLNDKTLIVLDNADYILVVTAPELPAIKNTKLFLELTDQLEFSPERIGVVMNRSTLPGGIPPEKIEKALKLQRAYRVPFDPKMHVAINKGTAVSQQDPSAPSAQAITYLARDLWQKLVEGETEAVTEMA
jgi:pilus assembly protein CpaE